MPDLGLENLAPRTDTSKEETVAPEGEKHHEQPEQVENLGASQTGAESEARKVSAESEQEEQQQDVRPPEQQAPRPTAPPQQPPPPKQVSSEAATK